LSKIQILSNTNFQLEKVIKNELIEAQTVRIAVAFLKKTGLDLVKKQLDYALSKKTNIEFIVGLDFKTTDYKALNELERIKQEYETFNYYCFGDKADNYNSLVFHPKIYLFNSKNKYISVVGSSNFTGGGLSTNFEVNTIFQETSKSYQYFSQLEAIYKEIKFQDSIFIPNSDYLDKYSLTRKEIEKFGKKALKSKIIKNEIKTLQKQSLELEGTVPSLKKIIIEFIKSNINTEINIKDIYNYCEEYIIKYNLQYKYQSKDFRATIRGELNKHEFTSKHKDNMQLFKRVNKGFYSLTDNGLRYEKR
jgi:HKD family nuclease